MVLEPISALSVAAAVVQFAEFCSKLISKGNQYHRSTDGALVEHTELTAAAASLVNLTKDLDGSLKLIRQPGKISSEEESLKAVLEDCRKIASEFVAVLDTFKVPAVHKRWKSFRQAFKTMWNKDKIEEMLRRLNVAREQLVIHLLVVLRYATADVYAVPESAIKCLSPYRSNSLPICPVCFGHGEGRKH